MASSWKTRECHFTWNLEKDHRVYKNEEKILRKIQNNLAETHFLKTENLLFKACLQLWFKKSFKDALKSLDEAKREIEHQRYNEMYKGYKCVELLNRMWIEHKTSNNVRELEKELETIELEEKDRQVVGAIKAAALMRLGPVMFDLNLELFKAAHQACPSSPDFLFGLALITGQKMRFMRPLTHNYDDMDQSLKTMMDEEKGCWEKLIDMKPKHKGYHYAKSMLGLNLSRRCGPRDKRKALQLLDEAYEEAPEIQEVCRNLIRFLKKTDLEWCISILETAISKQQDRAENRHQLALCFIEKAKKRKKGGNQVRAEELTNYALEELDDCLLLDSSHFYALLQKANQLQHLQRPKYNKSPEDCYIDMTQISDEFVPIQRLQLYNDFARYLHTTKSASKYSSRFEISQKTMDISTDESFEHQNEISGRWETTEQAAFYKYKAYEVLKNYYTGDRLKLGILFYQNFEFDRAINTLATVDQTNAEVPYFLAKTYLKKGQEKTVGNHAKPEKAAVDFSRARQKAHLARTLGLEPQKVRKILADTALAIAHNDLQANATDVIRLEDRCVTSYREAVGCGSLVAGLELIKLVKRKFITFFRRSNFIQMLAEIDVCFSQPQSDALHAEYRPLTFKENMRSQETDIEPSLLKNHNKIKADINEILSMSTFFQNAWKEFFDMEVHLLEERFRGTDGLQLDGREEAFPSEGVNQDVINKAVLCCCVTRPLLDRVVEKFQKDELGMAMVTNNYFPLILDDNLTPEKTEERLLEKLKVLKIDVKTHYPKLYEYLLKLSPKISAENGYLSSFVTLVNKTKHTNDDVLDIEPNPVKITRRSTDKVEEICNFFFDTMKEVTALRTRVEELVSALSQGGHDQEVDKAGELFGILTENEDFVVRMDNTWKFLQMLTLIRHCRESAGTDVDLTRWTELSERNSGFSKELRKGYLEVEAALLTNGGDQSSVEVLEKCHKTCIEADNLLNKSLQSEGNQKKTNFPFPDIPPGDNRASWKGKVKKHLNKDLKTQGLCDYHRILDTILEAQPCSNEDNYRFIAMRKFLDDYSRGTIKNTVSVEKEANSSVSYDILDLTRWCVNHAEKLASKVMAHNM